MALALDLRLAEQRADEQRPTAVSYRGAGEEALALKELRDLARGIHPAILTEPRASRQRFGTSPTRATVPVEVVASS